MAYRGAAHRALQALAIVATLSMLISQSEKTIVAAQSEVTERTFLIDRFGLDDPVRIMGITVNGSTLIPVPNFRTENGVVFAGVSLQASDAAWLKTSSVQSEFSAKVRDAI
jgi:hypothetical protein